MPGKCRNTLPAPDSGVEVDGEALANLGRIGEASAPLPLAAVRFRAMDLVLCDEAGIARYSLRGGPTTLGWEQEVISWPNRTDLQRVCERGDWVRVAWELCGASARSRACRVPLGVVAAEARGAEERGALDDAEGAVYRLSEAAAARHQTLGKLPARAGRRLAAEVEPARRPSHVPLRRFQRALAEELTLGRCVAGICSRAAGFSDSVDEGKVATLLYRRLGLLGRRDQRGRRRYARVASYSTAVLLCEALDLAPEQVGL